MALSEASTTVVNMNPDAVEKLIGLVGSTVGKELPKPADLTAFVALMTEHTDALIAGSSDSDAEGCFQILFFDLQEERDPAVARKLVSEISSALNGSEEKSALRLRILANLYNALVADEGVAEGQVRVVVLLSIIQYASRTGQLEMLHGYFDLLDSLVLKWQLGLADQRTLFQEVAGCFESQGMEEKAQEFLLKFLSTFDVAGESFPASEMATAAKGAIGAIKAPIVGFLDRHNLLGMNAIVALKDDKKYGPIYELLRILTVGKLADYQTFAKGGLPKVLADVDADKCVHNMRLLSMCSLATEHDEIPYQTVAETLDVPVEEVEMWVVNTITSKLIDAKMDQLQKVVLISRCTHRMFDKAQWEALSARLSTWKTNVRSILETVQRTQIVQQS